MTAAFRGLVGRELFRNEHWVLQLDDGRRLLFARRTAAQQLTAAVIEASFPGLEAAMDAAGRASRALIVDFSGGPEPARHDPEFERTVKGHADGFARGFVKVAALTRTVAGRAQVENYFRQNGFHVAAFSDEAAAIASLTS